MARVYGQALGRIAQTEVHVFRARVERYLTEMTPGPLDSLSAVRQAFGLLLPLADPIILGVHRRKIEQEMAQAAVWEVESEATGPVPGMVEVSLLFCDLRHFTSFSNRGGEAVALAVLDRLAAAVEEGIGDTGRLVKALGDGYLLAFPDPAAALASAEAIAKTMSEVEGPAIHAGLHHGRAVFRDGDYYGRGVNLAARLLSLAEADELLATAGVRDASPERPWKSRGATALLGFPEPIEVFALPLTGGGRASG